MKATDNVLDRDGGGIDGNGESSACQTIEPWPWMVECRAARAPPPSVAGKHACLLEPSSPEDPL